jgi:hypothetical protein
MSISAWVVLLLGNLLSVKVTPVDLDQVHLYPYSLGVLPSLHFLKGWMENSGELFEISGPACVLFPD